ncbi:MAG TPA: M28 family peptidase [Thermoanaerobaculia bacterium]|nr:M28 family peptidase [Thermoanaerobaculia bacterium]
MRRLLAIALPLLVVLAIVVWRLRGVAPHDDGGFSANRAFGVLKTLLAENVPHPTGTPANARVRDRIVARLHELGYDAAIQRRFVCNDDVICANVENIIATFPGAPQTGDAVLLAVHYDSVPAGPAASDDGVGVATALEIARVIRNEHFRNRVMLLIDDGEEAGLLGAEAFVADPALSRDVAAVVNLENRGTYGPSLMFETSRRNRWLISHFGHAVDTPVATSLFFTIYDLLPNDTDVTVFKREGKAALNFAAIRGVSSYHTPNDNLAHVDLRTLQHHGDNVLASLRALANADLHKRSEDNASYFDILGFFLVRWPAGWSLWIAIVSLLALAYRYKQSLWGILATLLTIALAIGGAFALRAIARARDGGAHWVADPRPSVTAMWLIGFAAALACAALFAKRGNLFVGVAVVWHVITIALALTLPGAAYLFLVPAVVLTICIVFRASETITAIASSLAGAIILFPLGTILYDALGHTALIVIALLLAFEGTLFAAAIARWRYAIVVAIAALVLAIVAMFRPPYTPKHPLANPLAYVLDNASQWQTNALTPELQKAAPFEKRDIELAIWGRNPAHYVAPAPQLGLPRVEMNAQRNGNRVTIHVRSLRNANRVALIMHSPQKIESLRVNGLAPARVARPEFVAVYGTEMTVEIVASGAVDLIATDTTFAFPPEGAALINARNASGAIPIDSGDVTITRTRKRV